eukprot:1277910-Rhodomonas_salina.1
MFWASALLRVRRLVVFSSSRTCGESCDRGASFGCAAAREHFDAQSRSRLQVRGHLEGQLSHSACFLQGRRGRAGLASHVGAATLRGGAGRGQHRLLGWGPPRRQ